MAAQEAGLSLVVDIGGTNTRAALARGREVLTETVRRYDNAPWRARGQDIFDLLKDFLARAQVSVSGLCVSAAGPIEGGVARLTNLDWTMDEARLRAATGAATVRLLNDLQAQGHALGHVAPGCLRPLVEGPAAAEKPMLIVGLGTGVNAAPVHGHGAARLVPASECGHAGMPVREADDWELMRFVERRLAARGAPAHCSIEEVLSGRGPGILHAFASGAGAQAPLLSSREVLAALAAGDAAARQAVAHYTRILARVLADLALIHLPFGGIYLIGGMARAMAPHLEGFGLAPLFRERRHVDLLCHAFRIGVVEDDYAALTGCAAWLAASAPG